MVDIYANRLLSEVAGKRPILIATSIANECDFEMPFLLIIEVRDEKDTTIYLQFATGTLDSHAQSQVGFSWLPDKSGTYISRNYVLSDFVKPRILADIQANEFIVS